MTASALDTALDNLSDIQREAVAWGEGPLLVLAGPGSGKTQVLTCRIARLLDSSRDKNFRVLALTFTNKAADEMKSRVATFVPGLEERANIGTFHSFCAQVLRQHGVHIGVKPDFAIYGTDDDRRALFEDALKRPSAGDRADRLADVRYLGTIDRLKARLVPASEAQAALGHLPERDEIALCYTLYDAELKRANALDFNSLILEAYRLLTEFPAIAARYRRSHPYWLVDEFQDTNTAQYRFIRALAGTDFRNVFAVADDDQIIYQWNGASFRQIQAFTKDFQAGLIQLPTNYRCPPSIVDAANRLVVYNAHRTGSKEPLLAGKTILKYPADQHIQIRTFQTDDDEADGIAQEIAARDKTLWGQVAVLARTRALLVKANDALQRHGVPAVIAQRRDDFLSPEFRWLVAALKQLTRPLDQRNLAVLIESFNRMGGTSVSADEVVSDAEATTQSYLTAWLELVGSEELSTNNARLLEILRSLVEQSSSVASTIEAFLMEFAQRHETRGGDADLTEDLAAWQEISRDIGMHIGRHAPLDQFLQELQLRSKEPSPKPHTVTLMTIHGAKGREFDVVYVIGLAEDILPSFQSKQKGDQSAEMEEERRNCFVAITRAKECLVLSRAHSYRGWPKEPSRFLEQMDLLT